MNEEDETVKFRELRIEYYMEEMEKMACNLQGRLDTLYTLINMLKEENRKSRSTIKATAQSDNETTSTYTFKVPNKEIHPVAHSFIETMNAEITPSSDIANDIDLIVRALEFLLNRVKL